MSSFMYDVLTIDKASELLGISKRVIAEKSRNGEIPAHKIWGKWFFIHSELVDFVRGHDADGNYKPF